MIEPNEKNYFRRHSNANSDEYKFGDKLLATTFAYYPITATKTTTISPNVGFLYEHTKNSELEHTKVDLTGGSILKFAAGAEISLNKLAFGFSAQLPLDQNFADGQTKEKIKGMVHVSFAR